MKIFSVNVVEPAGAPDGTSLRYTMNVLGKNKQTVRRSLKRLGLQIRKIRERQQPVQNTNITKVRG